MQCFQFPLSRIFQKTDPSDERGALTMLCHLKSIPRPLISFLQASTCTLKQHQLAKLVTMLRLKARPIVLTRRQIKTASNSGTICMVTPLVN